MEGEALRDLSKEPHMKKLIILCMFALTTLSLMACEKSSPTAETPATPQAPSTPTAEKPAEPAKLEVKEGVAIALADLKDGKNLEPAAKLDQIPAGAYFCDMGTAHYARAEEGDGRCPRCGMKLVKKAGGASDKPAEAGHDHAHGDGEGEHKH